MNVYSQLVQFLDQMEQQRRASLSRLPVKGSGKNAGAAVVAIKIHHGIFGLH